MMLEHEILSCRLPSFRWCQLREEQRASLSWTTETRSADLRRQRHIYLSCLVPFVMVGHSKFKKEENHRGCVSSGMESFRDPIPLYMRPIDDRCGGPADLVWIFFINGQPWSMHSNHFETLVLCCYCPSDLMQVLVSNSKTIFEFYFELRTTIGGL